MKGFKMINAIILVVILSVVFYRAFISEKYSFSLLSFTIMKEKVYIKGEKEVTLLGMIHIANKSFYKSIKEDFKEYKGLTLAEGILDKNKLLPKGAIYKNIASKTKYVVQDKKMFPNQINADIDASDLSEKTLQKLIRLKKIIQGLKNEKFIWDNEFRNEMIGFRNKALISKLEEKILTENKILIPWGAKHLPEIEDYLESNGFKIKRRKFRPSMNYFHWIYKFEKAFK